MKKGQSQKTSPFFDLVLDFFYIRGVIMAIKYSSVVPWGRSLSEYVDMFNLSQSDLDKKILGCGDGPASFNFELTQKGGQVVSIDPIYQMSKVEIENRISETYDDVINQTSKNREKFVWKNIKSVEELGEIRISSMRKFLDDFECGLRENRYISLEMPNLPFSDNQFDLSLSSHFLFLYSDNLNYDFHLKSIREMLRVSGEVRIFPIMDLNANISPYVDDIQNELKRDGVESEIIRVNYEFQRNGNEMLRLRKK